MINQIEQSWNEFMRTLSSKEGFDLALAVPITEFLDKQVNVDKARKHLFKGDFNRLLKHYLSHLELHEIDQKMKDHAKVFIRAFGQDRYNHLKLLVELKIMNEGKKPKRGLLAI